ncbi:MAG: ABC transporter permease [Firmicutes bacterium]|nr:ABC transporter permease [Bacillota bacterium]MCL5013680.1 ABC transporter permease [Bacillota bacterium]
MAALNRDIDLGWSQPEQGPSYRAWHRFLRNRLSLMGLIIVVFLILIAILAPIIAPYSPLAGHFSQAYQPPSTQHWLGTDELGRDVLSRIIYGTRGSLGAGVLIVVLGVVVGVPIGLVSGFYGGVLDEVLMRLVDAALAFPPLVLALAIAWILGPPPPQPNWGSMLQTGSQYLTMAPWISLFPGMAIFLAVLGFSTLGDGLRDVFDPKQ